MTSMIVEFQAPAGAAPSLRFVGIRPALSGSEKQISWAEDIRSQFERQIIEMMVRRSKVKMGVFRPNEVNCAQAREIVDTINGKIDDRLSEALDRFFSHTDARYWIDNRDKHFSELVK